jgi:hypothetical protein
LFFYLLIFIIYIPAGARLQSRWRSFATSANFNLEHHHSVCGILILKFVQVIAKHKAIWG